MKPDEYPHKAVETCRLLIQLTRIGVLVRAQGMCVGLLGRNDLCLDGELLVRRASSGIWSRAFSRYAQWCHLRAGHDYGCRLWGVPVRTIAKLARDWAGADSGRFIMDLFEEAAEETQSRDWHGMEAVTILKHVVGRRITV